jgi:S1-C subfamily serine protease
MDKAANRFVAFMAIIATPLAAGAFLMAWGPGNHYFDFSPANDGYVAPRDISTMISETENSTVTVICDVSKTRGATGTGWAIDASLLQVKTDRTAIVTNHHVIEQCIGLKGSVSVAKLYKKPKAAEILVFDKKNDLAILEADFNMKPLELSENIPWSGYWVMALGSADGFEGSVAFGNILNVTNEDILITNNISQGNSGGALVDNEGKVIGVVTWGMNYRKAQYNGAGILDIYCAKILKCEYEWDGEPTWFDYSE